MEELISHRLPLVKIRSGFDLALHPGPTIVENNRSTTEVVIVKNHMMAAVLYGKEHLQVEPVAVPTIESGDILVRVQGGAYLRHRCQGLPPRATTRA